MSHENSASIKSEVGKRLVKIVVAVVGLLIIMLIVDHLPMIRNAEPIIIGNSSLQQANSSQAAYQAYLSSLRYLSSNPTASDMQKAAQEIAKSYPGFGFIFPISIADAIIDTLIFIALIISALGFKELIRKRSNRLPEGGVMILLLVLTIVVVLAYSAYDGIFPPLLGTDVDLYGWFFLVLGIIPLIGLIVVGARNMDTITEVVFNSASRAVAVPSNVQSQTTTSSLVCKKCGAVLSTGVKFCGSCGAPVIVEEKLAERFCPSCGTKNNAAAKFCENCGAKLVI